MAKKKKLADNIRRQAGVQKKTLNPFEIHLNKQRFSVIGQKTKSDRGLPGVARAKATKKRKATLLQEYQIKGKANKFLDMRIGERNTAMTAEDRIMARFTAERMKSHRKKSIYNLADDEVLTHHGQTLSEIEKFDDPRSDSEDEEDTGKLGADFVEDAHFGGGVLTKTSSDGALSRKDVIQQLIADSKKRKAEKQRAREETLDLTEKLDTEWRELLPLVSASKNNTSEDVRQPPDKPDDYDKVVVELKFQARGKPSDRLKSEEEIVQEEKERLERLEEDRLKRMKGITDEKVVEKVLKHRSADDLDDGFDIDSDPEPVVAYNSFGELIGNFESATKLVTSDNEDEDQNSEEQEEDEESSSEREEDEEKYDKKDKGKDSEEAEEKEGEESEDESEEDSLSDLKTESESEEESTEMNVTSESLLDDGMPDTHVERDMNDIKSVLLAKKETMEQARKELPYTFEIPETYEEFQKLFCHQSPDHQAVITERMLKCNHPKLEGTSREKLSNLFTYFLQHLNDITTDSNEEIAKNSFHVLDRLAPFLYDLAHSDPESTQYSMLEVIKEKQEDLKKRRRVFPQLDVLLFLKLVSLLFPTSDFRHSVVTPTNIFMTQILVECRIRSKRDIAVGLYICTLFLEYTDLSKRFPPNAIYFLHKVVELAVQPRDTEKSKALNLLLESDMSCLEDSCSSKMDISDLLNELTIDDSFKLRALHTSVKLLNEFCFNLDDLPSCYEIFEPAYTTLKKVDIKKYPAIVQQEVNVFLETVNALKTKKMLLLVREKKRPKALRLYEPKIEPVIDGMKKRPHSKNTQERQKLVHKFKREMKGALREIRRDTTFITKLKLKDTLRSDSERKAKVKEIFGQAALQQAELKKFKKKK